MARRAAPLDIWIRDWGCVEGVFFRYEPGDEIGHADGMCRFLSKRTLLVNDCGIASMRPFGRQLHRALHAAKLGGVFNCISLSF